MYVCHTAAASLWMAHCGDTFTMANSCWLLKWTSLPACHRAARYLCAARGSAILEVSLVFTHDPHTLSPRKNITSYSCKHGASAVPSLQMHRESICRSFSMISEQLWLVQMLPSSLIKRRKPESD